MSLIKPLIEGLVKPLISGIYGGGEVPVETFNVVNGLDNVVNGVDNVVATIPV